MRPRCPQCAGHRAELVDTDVKIQRTVRLGPQPWLLSTWQCPCGRRWVTH